MAQPIKSAFAIPVVKWICRRSGRLIMLDGFTLKETYSDGASRSGRFFIENREDVLRSNSRSLPLSVPVWQGQKMPSRSIFVQPL